MNCPFCGDQHTRVIDTDKDEGIRVHRRRQCQSCGKRFNTYERAFLGTPMIIKNDGTRQDFNREKLIRGIRISCAKRPVPSQKIEQLAENIERELQMEGKREVSSRLIGDKVIAGLKSLDQIAYIRYAIVYLQLDDLHSVRNEIDRLLAES
jgi:transcriptional repressor NrdR